MNKITVKFQVSSSKTVGGDRFKTIEIIATKTRGRKVIVCILRFQNAINPARINIF